MTHTAKYLAIGLTVIVLASSYGVVPVAEANGGGQTVVVTHHQLSASPVAPSTPTTLNETTDAATERIGPQLTSTGVQIVDLIDEGETKRYEFTAEAGQMIRIVHNDIRDPANLTLYDPAGEAVARDTTHTKYRHPFGAMAEQSGTYTLEVRSNRSTIYQFQIETRNPDHVAPYENTANDNQETALVVEEDNVNLTGVLAEGEEDWYAVTLEEGERINVTLSHKLADPQDGAFAFDLGNGMQIGILDAKGRDVGQLDIPTKSTGSDWSEYDAAKQTALANSTGTYFIRVSNSSYMGGFAEYEMAFEVTETETRTST